MNNHDGTIEFDLWLNSGKFDVAVEQAMMKMRGLSDTTIREGQKMENAFSSIGPMLSTAFASIGVGALGAEIVRVTANFQKYTAVLANTLGSQEEAARIMGELQGFAAKTPFSLDELTASYVKLTNYGMQPNMTIMRQYGDLSAAVGKSFDQFAEAVADAANGSFERLRDFGITAAKEGNKITFTFKGIATEVKYSANEIKNYLASLGDMKGVKGAMDAIGKTMVSQISNLKDNIDKMFGSIGQSNAGVISGAIDGANSLVENYEAILKVLGTLVAMYGAYKAVIMLTVAAQKVSTIYTMALEYTKLAGALGMATANQMAFNKATLANPYAAAAAGIVALVGVILLLRDKIKSVAEIQKELENILEQSKGIEAVAKMSDRYEVLAGKREKTNDEQTEYNKLIDELSKKYPDAISKIDEHGRILGLNTEKLKAYNDEQRSALKLMSEQELKDVEKAITATERKLKAARENTSEKTKKFVSFGMYGGETVGMDRAGKDRAKAAEEVLKYLKDVEELKADEASLRDRLGLKTIVPIGIEVVAVDAKETGEKAKATVKAQISAIKTQLTAAKVELNKMRDSLSVATPEQIEEQEKTVKELEKQISILTGAKGKAKKAEIITEQEKANAIEEIGKKQLEIQNDIEAGRIEIMAEGTKKRIAEAENAHRLELQSIEAREADYLVSYNTVMGLTKDSQDYITELPAVAKTLFDSMKTQSGKMRDTKIEIINKEDAGVAKKTLDEIFEKYQTFIEKKAQLDKDYETVKKALADKPENLAVAAEKYKKDLKDLQSELLKTIGLQDIYLNDGADFLEAKIKASLPLFTDIAHATKEQLKQVKEIINGIEVTPEQKELLVNLGMTEKQVDELIEKLKDLKEKGNEAVGSQAWKGIIEDVKKLSGSLGNLGQALSKIGGSVGELGGALSGVAGSLDDVYTAMTSSDNIEVASSGINGLVDLITMVTNQIEANKKAQEEWNSKIMESAHLLRLAKVQALDYKESNVFGVEDPYAKAAAGLKQYTEARRILSETASDLGEGQVQTGTKQVVSGGNIGIGVGAGAAVGAAIGSIIPGLGTLLGAGIGAVVGGIIGAVTTKTEPVFNSLKKQYGQIYDPKTFAINPAILADYDKLDDQTKAMVDNWDEIQAKAIEAQEQIDETLNTLSGDIGQSLSDALVDAFIGGDINAAIDTFHKKVSKTIQDIIAEMIFSQVFGGMFADLSKDMKQSLGEGGDGSIVDDLERFDKEYQEGITQYDLYMRQAREAAAARGWDLFTGSSASTLGGAIKGMSEETGGILSGYANAIRINQVESMSMLRGQLLSLDRIASNTSHNVKLNDILDVLKSMKNDDGLRASGL